MSTVATIQNEKIITDQARAGILAFEEKLKNMPEAVIGDSDICPLNHTFCSGLYARDMQIPAGMQIVGKIHKEDHLIFLMEGEILVATEEGVVHLTAPQYFVSPPGVKRAAITLTDTVWINVHANPTNEHNLAKIEERLIAKSFTEFDKYAEKLAWNKKTIKEKIFATIKKYLP